MGGRVERVCDKTSQEMLQNAKMFYLFTYSFSERIFGIFVTNVFMKN
jgi:hypothetical protein